MFFYTEGKIMKNVEVADLETTLIETTEQVNSIAEVTEQVNSIAEATEQVNSIAEVTEQEITKVETIEAEKEAIKKEKKKEFLADIKVLFDSLRNMGLCMVFIFSAHFGFSNDTPLTSAFKYIGYFVGILFFGVNVYWAYNASIQKGIRIITISGLIALFIFQGVGLYQLKDIVLDTPAEVSIKKS